MSNISIPGILICNLGQERSYGDRDHLVSVCTYNLALSLEYECFAKLSAASGEGVIYILRTTTIMAGA